MSNRTRIDKWLFHARFYRSRSLAQEATLSGLVRLNGARIEKPGHGIKPGDVLTLPRGSEILAVKVLAIPVGRRGAKEAAILYEIVAETRP
jgi:ribosome-associated heat shock protein Hsp15